MKRLYLIIVIAVIVIGLVFLIVFNSTCSFNRNVHCLLDKAAKNKDDSICKKFDNPSTQQICYARIVQEGGDPSLCDKITFSIPGDPERKFVWSCYTIAAKVNKNPLICNNIKSDYYKDECYSELSTNSTNILDCENILDQFKRCTCFLIVAINKKDSSICDLKKDECSVGSCYFDYATSTEDFSICKKIAPNQTKDNCYYRLALDMNDRLICENIEDNNQRVNCSKDFNDRIEQLSSCENKSGDARDTCYSHFAERFSDSSICNKIISESIKEICNHNTQK